MRVVGRTISKYSIALLVIVLIGAFLRVYDLGTQSIWFDEASSIWASKMSLVQLVHAVATVEFSPPLYFVILHYWIALFGTSEVAVRSLSVLFGVLAIPVIYVLGRRLFNDEVGLVAALILAFSAFNIWYSQETRMYSLMVLVALLSMYFFVRFLQRNTVAISVGYVVCTTLMLYTHVYGVFVVIAQNVYLLTLLFFSRERTFRLRYWIALQVLVVVLYAPWISVLISETSTVEQGFWIPTVTLGTLGATIFEYAGTWDLWALFLALSVLSLFTIREVGDSIDWKAPLKPLKSYAWEASLTMEYNALYLLVVWLLAINVIPVVISLFSSPIYFYRYAIAGSAALYLIVAKGVSHLNYRYAKFAVVIVIVVLSAANLQAYYNGPTRPQARQAVDYINENAQNGDLVLIYPRFGPQQEIVFGYYYPFVSGVNVTEFPSWSSSQVSATNTSMGQGNVNNTKELQSDISGHNRVWLVVNNWSMISNFWNPQDFKQTFQTFHNTSYNVTDQKSFSDVDVYLFEKQVAGLVNVPGAAQADMMQYRYNAAHTGDYSPMAGTNMSKGKLTWSFKTGDDVISSPAVANGVVYVGSDDGNVYALNATTGTMLWNYMTGNSVLSSPAISNGVVYVGSYDNNTWALNATTGAKVWSFTTGWYVDSSPAVSDGVVYIGSLDSNLYALDATTGAKLWNYTTRDSVYSSPAVANGVVYVGSTDKNVYAIYANNGTKLWNYTTEGSVGSPTVSNGVVYVGCGSNVYALNATTGANVWNYATEGYGGVTDLAIANGIVYVGSASDSSNVYALNATTGAKLWNYTTGNSVRSSPAVANGVVYVGSDDNNIYALNATTGAKLWNYTTGNSVHSSPAVANGVVYVGSDDGNVYAIGEIGHAASATSQGPMPGFEVAFAVVGLAVAAYIVSRRR